MKVVFFNRDSSSKFPGSPIELSPPSLVPLFGFVRQRISPLKGRERKQTFTMMALLLCIRVVVGSPRVVS